MKVGDLIEDLPKGSSEDSRIDTLKGIVLGINYSILEFSDYYTVDVMWSTGVIETGLDRQYLRIRRETGGSC